jgi:transcriptional regulator with PAS, ATPase and Fis domain
VDFAEKYRMPSLELEEDAKRLLMNYRWQGNIRQLKNITEQISIIEEFRVVTAPVLAKYLPDSQRRELPMLYKKEDSFSGPSERELLYKVLFDMKRDINDLKKLVVDIMNHTDMPEPSIKPESSQNLSNLYPDYKDILNEQDIDDAPVNIHTPIANQSDLTFHHSEVIEEELSLEKKQKDLIKRALDKHKGKRKQAANELGISERTLYRKIKEYEIQ